MMKFFLFRKLHRYIALTVCLPLFLTLVTGILITVVQEWQLNIGVKSNLLIQIHTGEIFHLQAFYPILNGLGLIGLIVTGLSISGIFRKPQRS
ncbi:PepSY domain-containing protein [Tumidithrix helvetica PCC 7403]|uniref:peptidase n=1 Tax=Tumidithrix helvetica TaxID=3457545 RepID=UPI003CA31A98